MNIELHAGNVGWQARGLAPKADDATADERPAGALHKTAAVSIGCRNPLLVVEYFVHAGRIPRPDATPAQLGVTRLASVAVHRRLRGDRARARRRCLARSHAPVPSVLTCAASCLYVYSLTEEPGTESSVGAQERNSMPNRVRAPTSQAQLPGGTRPWLAVYRRRRRSSACMYQRSVMPLASQVGTCGGNGGQ